ncbi:fibronectin type III-like domain-contianing protein [Streptomyces himalayensis]|uniref:Fibronectin type III-like domain-contianing protein n=1 Tax=Streptomyces himalayensis subsp. himalayensis TaxID=2756131 RepID=A0A7W0DWR1_9ACTN|nr:fibronectin type III-like domain-contianing protein [Streptomyces himalayensis]MBA2951849.1 fibronectin type III-like domain-contianing protein [Streptomyces himalayensis subsp. himalayensis]
MWSRRGGLGGRPSPPGSRDNVSAHTATERGSGNAHRPEGHPVTRTAVPPGPLVGYVRVTLEAGASAEVHATFPADLAAYTGADGRRVVEPGALELRVAASSEHVHHTVPLTLTGPVREVGHERRMRCELRVK